MNKIKAIFFDIDGTLRSFKTKSIPESNKKILKLLKEKGIKIFIATGRAPFNISFLKDLIDIEFDGYVTMNGQICIDNNNNVIHENWLNKEDILNVLPYIEENNIACDFTEIDHTYLNFKNGRVLKLEKELGGSQKFKVKDDLSSTLTNKIYQLNVFIDEGDEEEKFLQHMPNSRSARWTDIFMDVIPKDGGKDVGITKIIEHYGIKLEETMAFGDGGNDIEMLKHVALGVAMGNARDDVKQHADFVTDTVDEDGIEKALKHFNII